MSESIIPLGFGLDPEAIILLGFSADAIPPPVGGGFGPTAAFVDVEAVGGSILDVAARDVVYIDAEPLVTTTTKDIAIIDVEPA